MAEQQTNKKDKQLENEITAAKFKVKIFVFVLMRIKSLDSLRRYFNSLCPTQRDKQVFIAVFQTLYPNEKRVAKYLIEWSNQAYQIEEENRKNKEKLKANLQKANSQSGAKLNLSAAPEQTSILPTYQQTETVELSRKKKKEGFLKKLKNLFGQKKSKVSKVSKEEIASEKQIRNTVSTQKINEKALMDRYNARVQARVQQKHLSQPVMSKGASVMSR